MPHEPTPCNVMHVIETMEVGGAENVVATLVNNASARFHPSICCLKRTGPMASRITRSDVEITELLKPEGNDLRVYWRLAGLLKARNIHVLHAHNWAVFSESAVAGALARVPARIHTVHGDSAGDASTPLARLKEHGRAWLERRLSILMNEFIAVSDQAKDSMIQTKGLRAKRIRVIRNGIPRCSIRADIVREKRGELGLADEDVVLTAVGRLAKIKNYPFLLRAFKRLVSELSGRLKLLIAGNGPEREFLTSQIRDEGLEKHVALLGERKDVGEILAASQIYVLPSLSEGVSMALLEAMAAGLPAVATRVGGNQEVVCEGETGFLVPSGDEESLTEALLRLVRDPELRRRLGQAGAKRVEEEFDISKTIRQYEELYLRRLGVVS